MPCVNCGATQDIVTRLEYVGGQGWVERDQCRDNTACWHRRDEQMGLLPPWYSSFHPTASGQLGAAGWKAKGGD